MRERLYPNLGAEGESTIADFSVRVCVYVASPLNGTLPPPFIVHKRRPSGFMCTCYSAVLLIRG